MLRREASQNSSFFENVFVFVVVFVAIFEFHARFRCMSPEFSFFFYAEAKSSLDNFTRVASIIAGRGKFFSLRGAIRQNY